MLRIFETCYQSVATATGGIDWTRVSLPYPGGVLEQPAWLMEALDYLRGVYIRLSADRVRDRAKAADKTPPQKADARG